jgi:hypothetical protein
MRAADEGRFSVAAGGWLPLISQMFGVLKAQHRAEERGALRWADDGTASARSAPRPHEIANGEIEADEHHERDKPLVALGRTVRNDKHAAGVDVRRAFPQEGANF